MSKRNKHGWNNAVNGGIAHSYMHSELGPWTPCPKKNCIGTLTDIYVRYVSNGPIFRDQECTTCGKVVKDPRTFQYLRDINTQNKNMRKQKSKGKPKRIYTNRTLLSKLEVLTNPRLQGALNHETKYRK